jgi:hypothetical protein
MDRELNGLDFIKENQYEKVFIFNGNYTLVFPGRGSSYPRGRGRRWNRRHRVCRKLHYWGLSRDYDDLGSRNYDHLDL